MLGPPMSQSRNNTEGSQQESALRDNNRSPNNKEPESLVQQWRQSESQTITVGLRGPVRIPLRSRQDTEAEADSTHALCTSPLPTR